jgi:RNA polymerase sigma-70 factor (ECF subfamily)
LTDSELVASILAGDMRAFETLTTLHQRTLLRTARAILRNDAEAEDAVQEALFQAYRALGNFRGESKLSTWLVRITANEALMRRRGFKAATPAEVEPDDLASREPGPESAAFSGDMRKRLEEELEALPKAYQAVFRLRALEELSVDETAAALGIPEATVRTRYFRARNLLRKSMARGWDKPSSLESPLLIIKKDLERLRLLRPHAALLREMDRAAIVSLEEATRADAVTMNSQVRYTDETTGAQRHVNIVYPQEAGGCACCISILAPVGTALIGLSTGQAIEWDFPDGTHRRLIVNQVIHRDCPLNKASSVQAAAARRT